MYFYRSIQNQAASSLNVFLDTPRFLFNDITTATGLPQANLKTWLNRGAVSLGPHDRTAGGSGKRYLLTLRTIYEFAVAAELMELGFPPARAFQNAISFSGRDRNGAERGGVDERNPSTLLYDSGKTIFIVYPEESVLSGENIPHEAFSTSTFVGRVERGADDIKLFDAIFMDHGCAAAVIHCNPILQGADQALKVLRG